MFSSLRVWAAVSLVALAALACKQAAPPAPPPAPAAAPIGPAAVAAPAVVAARVAVQVTEAGFVPARIPAKAGQALTLSITRKTDRTCAREILFAGQPGKTELPLDKTVDVTYTPKVSGDVKFGCAMGMMVGGVIAVAD
jgi:plastocyanin